MKRWIRALSCAIILGVTAQPGVLAADESPELPGDGGACCYDRARCNSACTSQYNECKKWHPEPQCAQVSGVCYNLCERDWP